MTHTASTLLRAGGPGHTCRAASVSEQLNLMQQWHAFPSEDPSEDDRVDRLQADR